jgi:hypothetical protein
MTNKKITANQAFFIKLGGSGEWEESCIKADNTIKLGYLDICHESCINGEWDKIRTDFKNTDNGAITRHINQIKQFYTASTDTLWVTFYKDRLWWCFSDKEISQLPDLTKTRSVIDKWQDADINGKPLIKGQLSGKLLAVQSFRGTICSIKEIKYLLHKINGTYEEHVAEAKNAVTNLTDALIPIIQNLHPKDFEILIDLIFRHGGWQRTGVAGEVEKDIDLDLLSPITGERIAIQIKSTANYQTFLDYQARFSDMGGYSRFYFITHKPDENLKNVKCENTDMVLWDSNKIAELSVRSGLSDWLIDKAS